jgi:uncharacterized protein YeaO (DUF488 family)
VSPNRAPNRANRDLGEKTLNLEYSFEVPGVGTLRPDRLAEINGTRVHLDVKTTQVVDGWMKAISRDEDQLVKYLVNMEEAGERFQFRFNPKVDASPDEMVDFLLEKMKGESLAAKLKKHLNLEEEGAYEEFLVEFLDKAKTAPKVFQINDYSGI